MQDIEHELGRLTSAVELEVICSQPVTYCNKQNTRCCNCPAQCAKTIFMFLAALQIESPTLTEEQLQDLLDQCARTMSRASEDVTSIANSTARFDL